MEPDLPSCRSYHVALADHGGDRELELGASLQVSDAISMSTPASLKLKDVNVGPGKSMKVCLPLPALPSSTCDAL